MKVFIVIVTDERFDIVGVFKTCQSAKNLILSLIQNEYEESEDHQLELYNDRFCRKGKKVSSPPTWDTLQSKFEKIIDNDLECSGFVSDYKIVEEEVQN